MIRRIVTSIIFAIIEFISLVAWSSIDGHLCAVYAKLCTPRPGICAGIDICPATAHMVFGLILFVLGPPLLFGVLGYTLSKRNLRFPVQAKYLLGAIVVHWMLTFLGTRVIAL